MADNTYMPGVAAPIKVISEAFMSYFDVHA